MLMQYGIAFVYVSSIATLACHFADVRPAGRAYVCAYVSPTWTRASHSSEPQ